MKKNKIALFVLPILVLFLISIVSAETLVGGKIYSSDFNTPSAAASVTVSCEHNGQTYPKYTSSLGDGTYAVEFLETECNETDIVKVTATKGDFSGESQGTINECDSGGGCEAAYFVIINIIMKQTTPDTDDDTSYTNKGSSSISVCYPSWECTEWSNCVGGLQSRTCTDLRKCGTTRFKPSTSRDCTVGEDGEGDGEITSETDTSEEDRSFFSGITGAVTGIFSTGRGITVFIFIIVIIVLAILITVVKKKEKGKVEVTVESAETAE